jgi:phage-related baseplate assembly protein
MTRFTAIDLSRLPAPAIVETLEYETIYQAMLADAKNRLAGAGVDYDVDTLETDPIIISLQAAAFRELLLRQRVNDGVKAVLLAFSWGTNLDHLGAYLGTARKDGEEDDDFRARIQLAIEAFSTAGPYGAYRYHALSAHPDVRDVMVLGPESEEVDPGQVGIYVLSSVGNGVPESDVTAAVLAACSADDVRPLTDQVLVSAATVTNYQVDVTITVPRGPDAETVRGLAQQRLDDYVTARHGLGLSVTLAGIIAAAMAPEVVDATVNAPAADVAPGATGAAYCTAVVVTVEIDQ